MTVSEETNFEMTFPLPKYVVDSKSPPQLPVSAPATIATTPP